MWVISQTHIDHQFFPPFYRELIFDGPDVTSLLMEGVDLSLKITKKVEFFLYLFLAIFELGAVGAKKGIKIQPQDLS